MDRIRVPQYAKDPDMNQTDPIGHRILIFLADLDLSLDWADDLDSISILDPEKLLVESCLEEHFPEPADVSFLKESCPIFSTWWLDHSDFDLEQAEEQS